ncbi:MAG: hypothetical protein JNM98_06100 [Rhodocyclaceae bacterium]|nr:hypothetical protein [Rhodocyclaceae bacterium]
MEWYTPAWVFDAVPARVKLTRLEDGLNRDWAGRVWLNPPYGPDTGRWVARLAAHGDGIAMVFARTDAAWCQAAMQSATAILFMRGRVEFIPGAENRHKRGRCGAATMMLGWGAECATALTRMRDRGVLIER